MERDTQKKHSLESYGFMLLLVVLLFMNSGCAKKIIKGPINQLQPVLNDRISGQMISENSLLYNDNLSGRIAWNEQYFMESLINMYKANRDKRYIEIFIRHADHVLEIRDNSVYRWDFMGRMRPGWQAGGYYTLGIPKMISDFEGLPSLEIQAIHRAGNGNTSVEVTNDGNNEFTLIIRNNFRRKAPIIKKFEHLNMSTVEKHINNFLSPEDWIRVKKSGLNPPAPGIYPLEETYRMVLHELHTPLIGIPFLRFAALVFEEKKLQCYKEKAMEYVTAFEESYRDYKNSWRENKDGGYFVFEPGGRYWASGLPVPYNGLSANGRFLLWLYRVTGKPEYLEKSTKLAKKIRAGVKLLSDGTLTMPYWYGLPYDGWKNKKTNPINDIYVTGKAYNGIEDVSHFTLTLLFMIDAYKMGIVFDDDVMIAVSNTFIKKIWKPGGRKEEIKWERDVYNTFLERVEKPKTGFTKMDWKNYSYLAHNLAGKGQAHNYTAGIFAGLEKWNKEIKDKILKIYCSLFIDPEQIDTDYEFGPVLLGWSMLALIR
ncbi:MAG: hypothetical protein U9R17_05140 [Thermodesulfobacteriota bacterium]|nr:hypothetical protein [Thermodesulfobacteriota bacterium]